MAARGSFEPVGTRRLCYPGQVVRVKQAILLAAVLALGCAGKAGEQPDSGLLPDGGQIQPELRLGYYYTTTYDPFEPGDLCPVFYALQGGSWTMPALRIRGIESPGSIEASFVTADGEVLGELDQRQSFFAKTDGWIEIKRLPIPARHAAPNEDAPIDDLFGQSATLSITVTDDHGHSASASADVVLDDNPTF